VDEMTKHVVNRQDLEVKLKNIEDYVNKHGNPKYGVFGPGSMMWKVGSESIIFLGSGYALLMQEAYPAVATGAHQHSKVKSDPTGRWKRTFQAVNTLIFGDLQQAFKMSRMIHNIHSKVHGKLDEHGGGQYHANEEDALLWVAATLCYTSIWMYEMGMGALTHAEKEQYYSEYKRFCYLFGISDETLPTDWNAFLKYYSGIIYSGVYNKHLSVKSHGKELVGHFTKKYDSKFHPLHIPSNLFMVLTTNFLPTDLRRQYDLKFGLKEDLLSEAILLGIRNTYSSIPVNVRMNPYFRKAMKEMGL
jgi:uncharacterized protein (DUF2236 family)